MKENCKRLRAVSIKEKSKTENYKRLRTVSI